MMTPTQYVELANATKSELPMPTFTDHLRDIAHAIIGIVTEGGELLDALKKFLFYGKPMDTVNLDEEFGDCLWYVAIYCKARGITFEQLMEMNIKKLATRYPKKFEQHAALLRDLEAERAVLERSSPNAN